MTTSRREFIKTAGLAAGMAVAPGALPAWIRDIEAEEADKEA